MYRKRGEKADSPCESDEPTAREGLSTDDNKVMSCCCWRRTKEKKGRERERKRG